jgi:competence protein ComEC
MLKRYLYVLITGVTLFIFTGCADTTVEHADKTSEETQKSDSKEINKNQNQESAESNPLTSKSPNSALMKVHYIDVGQGDSTLIQYSEDDEEFTILIDAGTYTNTNVIDYLQAQKIDEIDLAIGTHPDADHIGQLDQVLQTFDVEEVWLSGN